MHEIGSKACPQPFVKVGGYPCCQGPSHAWPFFWWSSFAACSHCPAGGGESESEVALIRKHGGSHQMAFGCSDGHIAFFDINFGMHSAWCVSL